VYIYIYIYIYTYVYIFIYIGRQGRFADSDGREKKRFRNVQIDCGSVYPVRSEGSQRQRRQYTVTYSNASRRELPYYTASCRGAARQHPGKSFSTDTHTHKHTYSHTHTHTYFISNVSRCSSVFGSIFPPHFFVITSLGKTVRDITNNL